MRKKWHGPSFQNPYLLKKLSKNSRTFLKDTFEIGHNFQKLSYLTHKRKMLTAKEYLFENCTFLQIVLRFVSCGRFYVSYVLVKNLSIANCMVDPYKKKKGDSTNKSWNLKEECKEIIRQMEICILPHFRHKKIHRHFLMSFRPYVNQR